MPGYEVLCRFGERSKIVKNASILKFVPQGVARRPRPLDQAGGSVERPAWRNPGIVKRQADGQWKFWRIMFNSTIPSATDGKPIQPAIVTPKVARRRIADIQPGECCYNSRR
ncbi:MAG: hypothetical protein LAN70_13980 [Acidobacteriia bacterium]|nr:hypothetical protein [Terriglobia bacterium]